MPRKSSLTQLFITRVAEFYAGGSSIEEVASQTSSTPWKVREAIKRSGVPSRRPVRRSVVDNAELREELCKRYSAGESASWLSATYGCANKTVRSILVDADLKIRSKDFGRGHRFTFTDKLGRKFQMRSSWKVKTAYWLDMQGQSWSYEVEAFKLNEHTYTPDFWVYDVSGTVQKIIDVKGCENTRQNAVIASLLETRPDLPFEVWRKPDLDAKGILSLKLPKTATFDPTVKHFKASKKLRMEISGLYESGLSVDEVAEQVGRSYASVRALLKRMNLLRSMSRGNS
jgi:hypothetical protein